LLYTVYQIKDEEQNSLKREDVEMAKELNRFFSSMFTKEAPHKYQFRERGDKVEEN
jgi:hypothetical protein